jgi:putative Mg2+ transporter-C (MgtC) family protein
MELQELLLRIIVASVLGGFIGLERDIHGRAAGLRTHMLVSMGSALFMIMSELVAIHAATMTNPGLARIFSDPGRIAAQIVTGIGFLGAGTIIKEGLTIRGLTTAACLWLAAAVGMTAGGGYYILAIFTTFFALIFLISLHYLERIYPKDSYRVLTIETPNDITPKTLINLITEKNVKVVYVEFERDYQKALTTIKLHVHIFHKGITDVLSHLIIEKIESGNIPLKKIKWSRK